MGNKRGVSEVRKEKYFKFAKELYKITKSPNKISPTDLKETCKIYEIGNIAPSVLKTCGYIKKTNGFYQWSGASPTKERMNEVMELLGKRERLSKLKYSLKNNLNINNFTKEEHKELELEGVIIMQEPIAKLIEETILDPKLIKKVPTPKKKDIPAVIPPKVRVARRKEVNVSFLWGLFSYSSSE
jgi:hypothetical protein